MPDVLEIVIPSLFGGTAGLVVAYLARVVISTRVQKAIQFEYDQKIENIRSENQANQKSIQYEYDKQIDSIRAGIRIAESERSVKFNWLHEQSAKTIAKTYELLQNLLSDHNNYIKLLETNVDLPQSKRREIFGNSLKALTEYVYPRQIFIPKSTADKIFEVVKECRNSALDFMTYVEEHEDRKLKTKKWIELFDNQKNVIIPLLRELADIFRDYLGVVEP